VVHCDECGFVYDMGEAEQAARGMTEGVETFADVLRLSPTDLARRTDPDTWSVLEYCCHVRDVLLVQRERVLLARRKDRPSLARMGRDERVEHDGYAVQDPHDVARQLTDAARMLAHDLGRLGSGDWDRTVMYNYPELRERSLRWVALHTLHEVRHHLLDVQRQF